MAQTCGLQTVLSLPLLFMSGDTHAPRTRAPPPQTDPRCAPSPPLKTNVTLRRQSRPRARRMDRPPRRSTPHHAATRSITIHLVVLTRVTVHYYSSELTGATPINLSAADRARSAALAARPTAARRTRRHVLRHRRRHRRARVYKRGADRPKPASIVRARCAM